MISLEKSVRTCKVDTAWANKVQSDRFLNPGLMVCPVWNGLDSAGREVCPDSFWTKNAGCNSAEDRVVVENNQRPSYFEYINLAEPGLAGDIYAADVAAVGGNPNFQNTMSYQEIGASNANLNSVRNCPGYGNFGTQMGAKTLAMCTTRPGQPCSRAGNVDVQNVASLSQYEAYDNRATQRLQQGFISNTNRKCSGF
jgi:hypothetical protein